MKVEQAITYKGCRADEEVDEEFAVIIFDKEINQQSYSSFYL